MKWAPAFSRWAPAIDDAITKHDHFHASGTAATWRHRLKGLLLRLFNLLTSQKHEYFAHVHFDTLIVGGDPLVGLIAAHTRASYGLTSLLVPSFPAQAKAGFIECSKQRFSLCEGPADAFLRERFCSGSNQEKSPALALMDNLPATIAAHQPAVMLLPEGIGLVVTNASEDTFKGCHAAWPSAPQELPPEMAELWADLRAAVPALNVAPCEQSRHGANKRRPQSHFVLITAKEIIQTSTLAPNTVHPDINGLHRIGDGARPTARYATFTPAMRLVDFIEACSFGDELIELQLSINDMESA